MFGKSLSNRLSPKSSAREPKYLQTSTIYMPVYPPGDINIRRSVTVGASMPATRTATASMRFTSTRWRASGPSCDHGCDRIAEFHRKSSRSILASSNSPITHAKEERRSSAHCLPPWSLEMLTVTPDHGMSQKHIFPESHEIFSPPSVIWAAQSP